MSRYRTLTAAWIALAATLLGFAVLVRSTGRLFGDDVALDRMPSWETAIVFVAAGFAWVMVIPLIRRTVAEGLGNEKLLVALIFATGLVLRLMMFGTEPVFEDDWKRYLWDGAVTFHGYNPFAVAPELAETEPYHYTLGELARQSGGIVSGINHGDLRTIYPPVAQAAFALAHAVSPFSLEAWRAVCLLAEIITAGLLLALLGHAGLAKAWLALYWWSPLAIKETINAAHMEAIVTPFVLAGLLLLVRARHVTAAGMLGVAAGAKLWPILLVPLAVRPLAREPKRLLAALSLVAMLLCMWALPPWLAGFDETSGFVAYAQFWQTNSAHFQLVYWAMVELLEPLGLDATAAALAAKFVLAALAGLVALGVTMRQKGQPSDMLARAALVTGAVFLLSPVQFPWYALWMLPLLVFRLSAALAVATVLVPLYYASFHYIAADTYDVFSGQVVWMIWLPVWALSLFEVGRSTLRRAGSRRLHA